MQVAVLGAGVSGLTVARRLQAAGMSVTVYEKDKNIGGLAKTRTTGGYVYDIHGGHIFNSKNKEVLDWVFSLLPKSKWRFNIRNAKIFFDGKTVSYPFELALPEIQPDKAASYLLDLISSRQGKEPSNFRDWLIWNFGKGIAESYMLPYNSKIWAYPLEDMETGWISGKMPVPDNLEILKAFVQKNPSERKMVHSTFYYPLKGGIQTMVNAIADGLIVLRGQGVYSCKKVKNKWLINGKDVYDLVISTIPLPELNMVMSMPKPVSGAIKDLKYNSLTTVLFSCPKTDISWLYIPDKKYPVHRVGYQSALTPFAVPSGAAGSGALEIIGPQFVPKQNVLKKLPKELKAKKMLDWQFTQYAYVIHDKNYSKNTGIVKKYFASKSDFFLLGRWGLWNYRNMDLCMKDAFDLAQKITDKYANRNS